MAATVRYHANPFIVGLDQSDGSVGTWTPLAACKVIDARCYNTAASGASDTISINDGTTASTHLISDQVDCYGTLGSIADTDVLANGLAEIDDDYRILVPGTDVLTTYPVSSEKANIAVLLVWDDTN
jgi:hypothetical protein